MRENLIQTGITWPKVPENERTDQLTTALQETCNRAQTADVPLYLTGGTAALVYGGQQREPSLDLDFFIRPEDEAKVQQYFGGEFQHFGSKPLFKSRKLVGSSGNGVDLDFISQQNVVPDTNHPDRKITLSLTDKAQAQAHEADFHGTPVRLLPPEQIIIAKLFAGRGQEVGKFDLHDSRSIMEAGWVRPDVFRAMVLELAGSNPDTLHMLQHRVGAALQKLEGVRGADALLTELYNINVGELSAERRDATAQLLQPPSQ